MNTIVRFSPQQSERCVYVTIINDTQVEQEELFGVSVAPIPGLDSRILFQQDTGEVVINDDSKLLHVTYSSMSSHKSHCDSLCSINDSPRRQCESVCTDLLS